MRSRNTRIGSICAGLEPSKIAPAALADQASPLSCSSKTKISLVVLPATRGTLHRSTGGLSLIEINSPSHKYALVPQGSRAIWILQQRMQAILCRSGLPSESNGKGCPLGPTVTRYGLWGRRGGPQLNIRSTIMLPVLPAPCTSPRYLRHASQPP